MKKKYVLRVARTRPNSVVGVHTAIQRDSSNAGSFCITIYF